jgi:hypothetical protein
MSNAKVRRNLMRLLACRDLMLENTSLSDGKRHYVLGERSALMTALERMDLFDAETYEMVLDDARATWHPRETDSA